MANAAHAVKGHPSVMCVMHLKYNVARTDKDSAVRTVCAWVRPIGVVRLV